MNTEPLQPLEAEAEAVKGRDQMGVPAATTHNYSLLVKNGSSMEKPSIQDSRSYKP